MKRKSKKVRAIDMEGVKKGHCALFFDGIVISGSCRFTAIKTKKRNGDAIFDITLIKPL